jgi:ankyrin repeat protein
MPAFAGSPLPPMVKAVVENDVKKVAALIRQGADVNVFQEGMDTPLVEAVDREPKKFNLEILKLLLDAKGIQVNKYSTLPMGGNSWERTALIAAAYWGNTEAVRLLLSKGAKVDLTDTHYPVSSIEGPKPRSTALTYAAAGGFHEAAALLIDAGAKIEWVNALAVTPLIAAASTVHADTKADVRAGHVKVLELLIAKGARVDYCPESANTKYTTLELPPGTPASVPRRVRIMGSGGDSALLLAAQNGFVEGAKVLLDRGADIEFGGGGPLRVATVARQNAMVEYLLSRGADIESVDNVGRTSLLFAASALYHDTVEILLKRGAKVDAAGIDGATALMLAINQSRPEAEKASLSMMRLLLDHGANVNFQGATGNTALMYASGWGAVPKSPARASLLLERGAKVALANKLGETALMHASARGYVDIMKLLMGRGADVNAKANNGDTSLAVAKRNGKKDAAKLLAAKVSKAESAPAPAPAADSGKTIVGAWEGLKNQNPYETHRFVFSADGTWTYEAGISAAFKKEYPDPDLQAGYASNIKSTAASVGRKGKYSFRGDSLVLKPSSGFERVMGWKVENGKLYLNGMEFVLTKAAK